MNSLCVGEVVVSKISWAAIGVEAGERGVVVERYSLEEGDWGAQIIFQNGGYCGFSKEEVRDYIQLTNLVIPELTTYRFTSVIMLARDYTMKKFDKAWSDNEHNQEDC